MNIYKNLFLLEENITYLNCSNMSPMLKSVKEAGIKALATRASPWKLSSADWFTNAEMARSLAAKIFQTKSDHIALVPSASYGIAIAAKNLAPAAGTEIIVLEQQFPSNYYAWEHLAVQRNLQMVIVKKNNHQSLTESILEKINSNTGIIAIPNCHWIDGTWIDLHQISEAAKTVGAYLVLDLSQSLGVLPIDIDLIQPDFAVSVGYKWLLGPYSLGYLYVSEKWQKQGEPLEYSWMTKKGSENFADLTNYQQEYQKGARKFDMGEFAQINLAPMAVAAMQQIIEWNPGLIQTTLLKLTEPIIDYKSKMGYDTETALRVGHIVSIPVNYLQVNELKERLQNNKVITSFRGNSIRVSPHLYNDLSDIELLISCL